MQIFSLGGLLSLLLGATAIGLDDGYEFCNDTMPCNCYYPKDYNQTLDIPCINSTNNCTWSHIINNMFVPIEDRFLASANGITLPGNFDPSSYGTFVAKFSGDNSCWYLVVPLLSSTAAGYCDDCIGIKVDGIIRDNNETLYKNNGDDLIIEADFPRVFGVLSFVLRFNGSNNFPRNCMCDLSTLTYNCSHLTTDNNGVYTIHIIINTTLPNTPEWCSNNVTILIQSKAQIVTVTFEQAAYNVSENNTAQVVLILSEPLSTNFTVEVYSTNITAFGGIDYVPGPYSVTFPANHTRAPLDVPTIDDNLSEGIEMFTLTINSSSLPRHVNVGNLPQATVTIVDDDVVTVTFEQAAYNVSENGTAQVVLILSEPSSTNFTVEVFSTNITAFGGMDYVLGPYSVTFPANHTCAPLDIRIIDDNLSEGMEMFTLTINSSSLPRHVNVGNLPQATVTIVDDDGDGTLINGAIMGMLLMLVIVAIFVT